MPFLKKIEINDEDDNTYITETKIYVFGILVYLLAIYTYKNKNKNKNNNKKIGFNIKKEEDE